MELITSGKDLNRKDGLSSQKKECCVSRACIYEGAGLLSSDKKNAG